MTSKKNQKRLKTAAEFLKELENDKSYLEKQKKRKEELDVNRLTYQNLAQPILNDLNEVGFCVDSIGELKTIGNYIDAIPILLHWLPVINEASVKLDIIRALSVPWTNPLAAPLLIKEFNELPENEFNLKWAIGNALEVISDDSVYQGLADIAQNTSHGKSREMVVLALGKMHNPDAIQVLKNLLKDNQVQGHAIMALGKLKTKSAKELIEPFLKHSKPWIRNEASKAIRNIEK